MLRWVFWQQILLHYFFNASFNPQETTAALKSQGALSRGRLGSAGSGGLRKRINRQASSGPETRKKRFVPPPANVVGPETVSSFFLY